jgi:hypothetical protein
MPAINADSAILPPADLIVDRIEYITAIRDAIHSLETARVTFAKMVRGLEEG